MPACFQNTMAQTLHRYMDYVLLLFIAALAWWLMQLDDRLTRTADRSFLLAQEVAVVRGRNEEVLRRLDAIDTKLSVIDARIYQLSSQRFWRGETP